MKRKLLSLALALSLCLSLLPAAATAAGSGLTLVEAYWGDSVSKGAYGVMYGVITGTLAEGERETVTAVCYRLENGNRVEVYRCTETANWDPFGDPIRSPAGSLQEIPNLVSGQYQFTFQLGSGAPVTSDVLSYTASTVRLSAPTGVAWVLGPDGGAKGVTWTPTDHPELLDYYIFELYNRNADGSENYIAGVPCSGPGEFGLEQMQGYFAGQLMNLNYNTDALAFRVQAVSRNIGAASSSELSASSGWCTKAHDPSAPALPAAPEPEPETPAEPSTSINTGGNDPAREGGAAVEKQDSLTLNGKAAPYMAYALRTDAGDTNYIKLRDLAFLLKGTGAEFSISQAADKTILVNRGETYEANGSEMQTPFTGEQAYAYASSTVQVNGQPVELQAFTLGGGGYTYFKLKDIAKALDFSVVWVTGTGIVVDTTQPYAD